MLGRGLTKVLALAVVAGMLAGCSLRQMTVNMVGDALAGTGGVYESDNDPELIFDALPFGLKTYESLLAGSPEHPGLLLTAANGFTAYAFLLQSKADRLDAVDRQQARRLRARARNLYLRGRNYAFQGLAAKHPNFAARLFQDRASPIAETTKEDVPFLYWAGAAWAGALSAAMIDLNLIAELPTAGALVARVLELDESYADGAAHEFFISYEGGRPGGSAEVAREHYRRALELSGGARATVHLALAETVAIQEQNLGEFRNLISAVLAVDPDRTTRFRLVNTIARRRALWLESRIPELFVEADIEEKPK